MCEHETIAKHDAHNVGRIWHVNLLHVAFRLDEGLTPFIHEADDQVPEDEIDRNVRHEGRERLLEKARIDDAEANQKQAQSRRDPELTEARSPISGHHVRAAQCDPNTPGTDASENMHPAMAAADSTWFRPAPKSSSLCQVSTVCRDEPFGHI